MDDFQKILEAALAAQKRGADMAEVNKVIKETTGLENLPALITVARGGAPEISGVSEKDEARARILEGGGNAFTDFGRMAAQGATFGFGDEIAGAAAGLGATLPGGRSPGEAYRETTDASRQRVEDLRTAAPLASSLSELAGGLLVPGIGSAKAAKGGGTLTRGLLTGSTRSAAQRAVGEQTARTVTQATRGVLGAARAGARQAGGVIGRGAAAGGAYGALQGAGNAEGGLLERVKGAAGGAVTGAAFGGAAGAALGVFPGLVTGLRGRAARNRARNPRIEFQSRGLLDREAATNLPSEMLKKKDAAQAVAQRAFKELDDAPPVITNRIREALVEPLDAPEFTRAFEDVGAVAQLNRFKKALDPAGNIGLKFEDVQMVRGQLQGQINNRLRQEGGEGLAQTLIKRKKKFDDAVEAVLPNREARLQWRRVAQVDDGLATGKKAAGATLDEARLLESQFRETGGIALDAFRVGMLDNIITRLGNASSTVHVTDKLVQQLGIALEGRPALQSEVIGLIERESRDAAMAKLVETATKTLGFLLGGSSLVGAGFLSLGG